VRVLLTGSKGFIGSHLAREFPDATKCDIKNGWDCRDLFRSDDSHFDLIFHCAATVGGREGIDYNSALLGANNLQLDGAMFEWALRTRPGRVVYFSSAAAYPTWLQSSPHKCAEYELHPERMSGMTDESYGWAKLTGDLIAERVRKAGIPVTVVRPFSCYDFDQDETDYPFPAFVRRAARKDDPFVVWGDGTQVRDWIHVDDLIAAILTLIEAEVDGPVNLGTGVGTSMDDLARLFMSEVGYEAPIQHLTDKPMGVQYRVANNALLRRYYEPRINLQEGIRQSLAALAVAI